MDLDSIQYYLNLSNEDKEKMVHILSRLRYANSGQLLRIKSQIAKQLLSTSGDLDAKIDFIESVYSTNNLPEVAKRFLVFKELHPYYLGESDDEKQDDYFSYIPTLNALDSKERKHVIFSDLLWCAIESNDRELWAYLEMLEQGNDLYTKIKASILKVNELPSDSHDFKVLKQYAEVLNTLYNLSQKLRSTGQTRVKRDDLEQELFELDRLFQEQGIREMSLPDRIVETFGYWAGIHSLAKAKEVFIKKREEAHRRNVDCARRGIFKLKVGDFVKGVEDTRYFSSMLQKGIVAKDYLGESSKYDYTPMDMDVEKVIEEKATFREGFESLGISRQYTDSGVSRKSFGDMLFVFSGDEMFETRDKDGVINDVALESCIKDKRKKECFFNWSGGISLAYGIRTGVGSENIKFIVVENYEKKLGLEIALNGFYIPVINHEGELVFTPEMYEELRSKMNGMRYFDEDHFEVDETAKNIYTTGLSKLIRLNRKDASQRRAKIIEVIRNEIEKLGLALSSERKLDLIPGTVELIDTGSTGRGTNEPGDGDFDFMIRLDRRLMEDRSSIIQALENVFTPEIPPVVTDEGDLRYKEVPVEGIKKKVDIDLSFIQRTNEIEYSTEESIKDRLQAIREHSEDDYNIVVANILLAKKFLKLSCVYKKANGPEPENGEADTRGGFGAIGIENWILQNGGSFEKAARDFLRVAGVINAEGILEKDKLPISFKEFAEKYNIWDFGENWLSIKRDIYPHDDFVRNMSAEGYKKMVTALKEYIIGIEHQRSFGEKRNSISLKELIEQDPTVFEDKLYLQAVASLLEKAKGIDVER